jgi:Methyltransferase domain
VTAELEAWMTWLEARHLADLRFAEVSRALRALSSAYVERRETAIAAGRVLDTAGKRAAFALYYGPLHFVATQHVLESLGACGPRAGSSPPVLDLGCGTGAAGLAVAGCIGAHRIHGVDTHPWAVGEARATYARFGLDGTVARHSVTRMHAPDPPAFVVAGYVANELPAAERSALLRSLLAAVRKGSEVLVLEPLSGRAAPWWAEWAAAFAPCGGRADSWTVTLDPPELTRRLGKAAGLTSTVAKLRSLHASGADPVE